MLVRFKKPWFGPAEHAPRSNHQGPVASGYLYDKTPPGAPAVDLPDYFRSLLSPSFATIVDEDDQPEPVVAPPAQALRHFDEDRAKQDAEAAVLARADANRVAGTRKPPRS